MERSAKLRRADRPHGRKKLSARGARFSWPSLQDRQSLTDAEVQVLLVIDRLHRQTGYMPVIREIAESADRSLSTVHSSISRLRKLGYLVGKGSLLRTLSVNRERIAREAYAVEIAAVARGESSRVIPDAVAAAVDAGGAQFSQAIQGGSIGS